MISVFERVDGCIGIRVKSTEHGLLTTLLTNKQIARKENTKYNVYPPNESADKRSEPYSPGESRLYNNDPRTKRLSSGSSRGKFASSFNSTLISINCCPLLYIFYYPNPDPYHPSMI